MSLKNKINLSITILFISIILLFVFLIYPIFLEIKKISQDFLSQKEKLVSLERKSENFQKFQSYYLEIKPNLEKIDQLFIDPKVPIDFIGFLEKTARDYQIPITISPGLPTKIEEDPWPSLNFQITSLSSFPDFLKFLEKLESSNYLIEIQNLNIARLTETELKTKGFEKFSLGDARAILSIKVYTK